VKSNHTVVEELRRKVEVSDAEIVGDIRGAIDELCDLFNQASERGITINFSIDKPPNAKHFIATKLEINKNLFK
jgi:hypothetical protein